MNLHVRRLEQNDLATRVAWFNTEVIYKNMTVDVPMSIAATQKWFARASGDQRRRDFTFLLPADVEEPIAMGGLVDIDLLHSRAELYMMVNPQDQGRGVGRAVLRWICNYGFSSLNLNKVHLTTLAHNRRAQHLYESHGFTEEGRLREHLYHCGAYVDRHIYGLLRDEWLQTTWYVKSDSRRLGTESND